jgi:integrase
MAPRTLKGAIRAAETADGPRKMLFTKARLDELLKTRPHQQRVIWDSKASGLCVLVSRGAKDQRQATVTFRVVYYLRPGKPMYLKIGRYPDDSFKYPWRDDKGREKVIACSDIDLVRDAAHAIRIHAKDGNDPRRPVASNLFEDVVTDFIALYAKPKNRSWKESERIFNTYVLPDWRYLKIDEITRERHITPLMDKIQQKKLKGPNGELVGGLVTADQVLAQISKLFNWHATRAKFTSPLVKGMRRAPKPKERARRRVLTDQELRLMWPILGEMGTHGAAVKCMLLTAQRARKVEQMRRSDIKDRYHIPSHEQNGERVAEQWVENVWDASRDDDPFNKQVSIVPLSRLVREIIDAVPIIDAGDPEHQDYVFSVSGRHPVPGRSRFKARLDRKLLEALRREAKQAALDPATVALKPWQLRDLRRTARTLMSRAGISVEIAEHMLGHAMPLIQETYDRHDYLAAKREAFEKLANWITHIVSPPTGNVTRLDERRRAPAGGP